MFRQRKFQNLKMFPQRKFQNVQMFPSRIFLERKQATPLPHIHIPRLLVSKIKPAHRRHWNHHCAFGEFNSCGSGGI